MEQAVYKLLTLNRNSMISAFQKLKKLKGLSCIIYPPDMDNQPYNQQYEEGRRMSIFGLEDLADYEIKEQYSDKLLIFNLFQEGFAGQDEFDAFSSTAYCLSLAQDRLPLQTLIEINFYGRKMFMKVDDHKGLCPSVTDQLLIKNTLVAAT